MIKMELLFIMQCIQGILMLFFLLRINNLKKQVDNIVKEVKAYLTFIEEEELEEVAPIQKNVKISKEEAENHLIQSVLQEYFP